ncbi:GNAT family N-acetyltransferase [Paenibacillus radicis (ex Gao et al. 2016)]|uniref:Acetyltransferase n=1 Tax=Paenibacillus radicis (ex Gao et al. 2016) TaxID=1737354 RepID=A0A917GVM0_9BACL|nr:GNAT family N-acetyltransferase [Paenibacillus radicis (ex Gao et al. 2016)]GGG58242.1 acetyltransferase [Paenibacillus radicis (ex Gao et al. 2016)]
MEQLTLQIVDAYNEDLRGLIAKLDNYLFALYPTDEVHGVELENAEAERVIFVGAYLGKAAVGCGAYRPFDERSCELKRIFVDPAYRNKGIASRILSFLEQEIKHAGYHSILLETGLVQPESIALYKKFGFVEIERFGPYIHCSSSYCMGKTLPSSSHLA